MHVVSLFERQNQLLLLVYIGYICDFLLTDPYDQTNILRLSRLGSKKHLPTPSSPWETSYHTISSTTMESYEVVQRRSWRDKTSQLTAFPGLLANKPDSRAKTWVVWSILGSLALASTRSRKAFSRAQPRLQKHGK